MVRTKPEKTENEKFTDEMTNTFVKATKMMDTIQKDEKIPETEKTNYYFNLVTGKKMTITSKDRSNYNYYHLDGPEVVSEIKPIRLCGEKAHLNTEKFFNGICKVKNYSDSNITIVDTSTITDQEKKNKPKTLGAIIDQSKDDEDSIQKFRELLINTLKTDEKLHNLISNIINNNKMEVDFVPQNKADVSEIDKQVSSIISSQTSEVTKENFESYNLVFNKNKDSEIEDYIAGNVPEDVAIEISNNYDKYKNKFVETTAPSTGRPKLGARSTVKV